MLEQRDVRVGGGGRAHGLVAGDVMLVAVQRQRPAVGRWLDVAPAPASVRPAPEFDRHLACSPAGGPAPPATAGGRRPDGRRARRRRQPRVSSAADSFSTLSALLSRSALARTKATAATSTGTASTAIRRTQTIPPTGQLVSLAIRSLAEATSSSTAAVAAQNPKATRPGCSRGRSSSWWGSRSPVTSGSMNGQAYNTRKARPGMSTAGTNGLGGVYPNAGTSQAGHSRSAPSIQPTYQSGWAGAVTEPTSNGPYSQTGLIWASPPRANTTAITAPNRPRERK